MDQRIASAKAMGFDTQWTRNRAKTQATSGSSCAQELEKKDGDLQKALFCKELSKLQSAIEQAKEAGWSGLKSRNYEAALKMYHDLTIQNALAVGEIENLEQAIGKAEKEMEEIAMGTDLTGPREIFRCWRELKSKVAGSYRKQFHDWAERRCLLLW